MPGQAYGFYTRTTVDIGPGEMNTTTFFIELTDLTAMAQFEAAVMASWVHHSLRAGEAKIRNVRR
jgi:hypothetical protein